MKKHSLLTLSMVLLTGLGSLFAQALTYMTVEAGPQWKLLGVGGGGGYFEQADVRSFTTGMTFGQELFTDFYLISGFYMDVRREGMKLKDERSLPASWSAGTQILIPLRAEFRYQPTEYPFSFTPRLGFVFGLNGTSPAPWTGSGVISSGDGTPLAYDITGVDESSPFALLEIGMGANYRLSGFWQVSLNLSYMAGVFTPPVSHTNIAYDNGSGSRDAEYSSRGNSLVSTLALNIPLSNLWQNKNYRVRKRIENSVYKGKAVDRRGIIYIGADIGSLWSRFSTTNPAVGPRPMANRGIFRYANFQTGIYAGYMLSGELGMDLGVNYRPSSSFFSVMVDHEDDLVVKYDAPMILEFPLRLRYLHNLYDNELHLGIYGGGSLLAQFSQGPYASGNAPINYAVPGGTESQAEVIYSAERMTNFAPLLRLGAGLEWMIPMPFPLAATIYVNYIQGFMTMDRANINIDTRPNTQTAMLDMRGGGWSIDMGVKFPFRLESRGKCGELPKRRK